MAINKSALPIGSIYLLSNPAMPGMVKIGRTSRDDVNTRVGELYTTSVPLPYFLESEWFVEWPAAREALIHGALARYRVAPDREFFKLPADEARERITAILYKFDVGPDFEIVRPFLEMALMMQMAVKHPERFKSMPISQNRLADVLDAVEGMGESGTLSADWVDIIKHALIVSSERYNQVIRRVSHKGVI